jgi:hypothetical protein
MKLAVDHPCSFVSIFAVLLSKGWENTMIGIVEHPLAELQPQPVFKAVGLVLGRVELELHAVMYVIHI